MGPRVSVVIPAYNEDATITKVLDRLLADLPEDSEVLIVVDDESDSTAPVVAVYADPRVRLVINRLGRGPARAIKSGIWEASAPVTVVSMADGSDDPATILPLVRLVERGVVIAAASRYMPGGQQVGAPPLKAFLSRGAGITLHAFAGVGTHDATNSFKAYDTAFVREVGIDSEDGFEIGLELIAKARRLRRPIAEVPTIWLERDAGVSNFQIRKWLPKYLRWYALAYGGPLSATELRARVAKINGNG
jgi:dolichol-phosphate mannosyltransferase